MSTPPTDLVLFEEDERRLTATLQWLCAESGSRAVFLTDRHGRLVAAAGESAGIDITALASLVAGSMAATGSLADLMGASGFQALSLEGDADRLHITAVERRLILVVVFDRRAPMGLVRLRIRRAIDDIGQVLVQIDRRAAGGASPQQAAMRAALGEITDDDIDKLLSN